jgi:hypothetical protein
MSSQSAVVVGEERGQGGDDIVDDVPLYPSKGVGATPPRGYRPLPEEYVEGQQGVHVHLWVEPLSDGGGMGSVGCDLCAIFKRTQVDVHGSGQMGRVGKVGPHTDGNLRDVRCSMFVHVAKLVQLPKGVQRKLIPSVVRLQSLDNCLRSWVDAPDFVTTFPRRPFSVAKDGELRLSIERSGQMTTSMMPNSEFVGKVVESGSEVVETVADDEAEHCGDWFGKSNVHDLLTTLPVEMTVVSVRVSFAPLANLRVKTV